MTDAIADAAAALLGRRARASAPLSGGSLTDVVAVTLDDGRRVVAKGGPDPRAEADMLRAIGAAGVAVPEVLADDATHLVLTEIPSGGALNGAAWRDLGTQLSRLHGVHGPNYGWPVDYAFGAVPIRNRDPGGDWPGFYARQRLAVFESDLPASLSARIAALRTDLSAHLPRHPPASLLHGDLWGGNILSRDGRITALIDPACYHGHAEVDLAMLCLFGTPPAAFWEAYGMPSEGWSRRRPIYQLWPALVHLRLFGSGYRGLVERCLDEAGV